MKNVIFIAPPAAGKGTYSEYLKRKYHYNHISTGALFRERIALGDEEGKELEALIAAGKLIDDERAFKLLKEKLEKLDKSIPLILDGVPRTLHQAHLLDKILNDLKLKDIAVIEIHVDKEVLKKRVMGRRICKKCDKSYNIYFDKFKPLKENVCDNCGEELIARIEDNEESFEIRYQTLMKNNEEILDFYKDRNCCYEINNTSEDQTESFKELDRIVGATID